MSNTEIVPVDQDNYPDVLNEINEAFWDIPFENSQFQTEQFVIGGSITPERAYRNIGLRMQNRLRALQEAQYGRAKEDIEIEKLQHTVDTSTDQYEARLAALEIDFKLSNRPFTDKLINDALKELNVLYAHFKALPRYTREEFEQGERQHFEVKLTRQVNNVVGAHEALVNMAQSADPGNPAGDFQNIAKFEVDYQAALAIEQQTQAKLQ